MLLGRESERAAIERLLADARVGTSGALIVSGEAGIGKSALLGHAASAAAGMRVLSARGIEREASIPFAGLLELLRHAQTASARCSTTPAPHAPLSGRTTLEAAAKL